MVQNDPTEQALRAVLKATQTALVNLIVLGKGGYLGMGERIPQEKNIIDEFEYETEEGGGVGRDI